MKRVVQGDRVVAIRGVIGESLSRLRTEGLAALSNHPSANMDFQCLVHNDLVRGNIVVASDRAMLIDWDWAMNASPVVDLCGFLSPFVTSWDREMMLGEQAIATFLRAYFKGHDRADVGEIYRSLSDCWALCGAVVANWDYLNSSKSRPHLKEPAFYRRACARTLAIGHFLKVSARPIL